MEPTKRQEEIFECLTRRLPKGAVADAELRHGTLLLNIEYKDPRPSKNGLVDSSFYLLASVGPRGGIRFGRVIAEGKSYKCDDLHSLLFWANIKQHAFYA